MALPLIRTERLDLSALSQEDLGAIREYYLDNARHLEPWEPIRMDQFHTKSAWQARIETASTEMREGRAVKLVIRLTGCQDLIGVCNFTNIVRGPFQACTLGYSIAASAQGQGLMFEALEAAISYMFKMEGLHRIMANYIPENARSARLLERLGFETEGLARNYLHIAGRWRDHVLTAKTNPDFTF
ncbi:MAG: ribosomal protein S5-alanine N-acetyltransferase [Hyphomonadaceae bacterium]|nr:ribosomal protein S5-alanine N-acetyltransferase [Hyphomonadaceae bacterium]